MHDIDSFAAWVDIRPGRLRLELGASGDRFDFGSISSRWTYSKGIGKEGPSGGLKRGHPVAVGFRPNVAGLFEGPNAAAPTIMRLRMCIFLWEEMRRLARVGPYLSRVSSRLSSRVSSSAVVESWWAGDLHLMGPIREVKE